MLGSTCRRVRTDATLLTNGCMERMVFVGWTEGEASKRRGKWGGDDERRVRRVRAFGRDVDGKGWKKGGITI